MEVQQMIEQPLHVSAFDEEVCGARLFEGRSSLVAALQGQPENLDAWQLGVNARRRLEPVHVGHRRVHQDDIRLERAGAGDRLEAVRRLADHRELRPLVEELA